MGIRYALKRAAKRVGLLSKSPSELLDYWSSPTDAGNRPQWYASVDPRRADIIVELLQQHGATSDWSVLEIGCNVGRNLTHLRKEGFVDLSGVELSKAAISEFARSFPDTFAVSDVSVGSLQEILPTIPNERFDAVFSLAVLEHIHYDDDRVMDEIVRITSRLLITVEDEAEVSPRHFPRDYRREFEAKRGMTQVAAVDSGLADLPPSFVARAFKPDVSGDV